MTNIRTSMSKSMHPASSTRYQIDMTNLWAVPWTYAKAEPQLLLLKAKSRPNGRIAITLLEELNLPRY